MPPPFGPPPFGPPGGPPGPPPPGWGPPGPPPGPPPPGWGPPGPPPPGWGPPGGPPGPPPPGWGPPGGPPGPPPPGWGPPGGSPGGPPGPPPPGWGPPPPPGGGGPPNPPSGGGSTNPPSGGGSTNPPSGGGSTNPPSGGGTTNPPSGGGTTNPPGGGTTNPPSGGGTTNPPGGGTTNPPGGGGTQPPSGGTITKPDGPTGAQNRADWTIIIPAGWSAEVTSTSKQTYNQGVCAEYSRDDRHVRNMLANTWGQSGAMRNTVDGTPIVHIAEVEVQTSVTFKWYQSEVQKQSKNALIQAQSFANNIAVTKTESPTEVVYTINVFDKAGKTIPDQVTIVRCTKVINNDPLGLSNVQGDVIPGLPKALEYFYYFQITDIARFKQIFTTFAYSRIVTSERLVNNPPPPAQTNPNDPFLGFNVAFTSIGIARFGLDPAAIGDPAFVRGQQADAKSLGDPGVQRGSAWSPDWDAEYKANIDGIFLITAYNETNAQNFIKELEAAFQWAPTRSSIRKVVVLHGFPRPGKEGINDHFGYRGGGMTNPQVKGVTFTDEKPMRFTGTPVIPIGVLVMGREGDDDKDMRPEWAVDGSLIATRKLNNLVPEFDAYLLREGPKIFPGMDPQKAADKLGARLMGRWKNGTAVEMSPDNDAPEIAADDKRVNNFEFDQSDTQQRRCPFAAHMRKSNPRNDVPPSERLKHLIRRHNMPYGPEVSDDERQNGTTAERGLHLCIYQSSIERGFRHIQTAWYNAPQFPPGKPTEPGWDPVFGQTGNDNEHRYMSGVDPANPQAKTTFLDKFVDPRGGEYFFSPSMKTLKDYICA